MKIIIDDEWFLDDDGYGYQLTKWTGKKDKNGNPIYDFRNYPATLEGAIRHYARMKVVSSEEKATLREYVERTEEAFRKVEHLIRGDKHE